MKLWKEVGIAIAGVVLTVAFGVATVAFVDEERFQQIKSDHSKLLNFLVVPFDLWLVAFAVVVGVALSLKPDARGKLVSVAVALTVILLFIFCSFVFNSIFPSPWFKIYIPDLLGVALIGFTAHQVSL
jgi:hypothetical protein